MPDSNVSSCVLNILGSFSSSLGLYKKLSEKRRKLKRRKKHDKAEEEQEQRLARSLRQGSEDISQEYHKNVHTVGDPFAIGDAIAQTSLAEILLRLNVGLVGIITSFLTHTRNDVHLDYKGLADLSEQSRVDTCRTLRLLFKRLTVFGNPRKAITSREHANSQHRAAHSKSTSDLSSNRSKNAPRPKIRGPTLAQVVIQDSSKPPQIAMVRPGERRKKARPSAGSDSSSSSRHRHDSKQASPTTTPPPAYTSPLPSPLAGSQMNPNPPQRRPQHKQSLNNFASNPAPSNKAALRSTHSAPRLQTTPNSPSPLPPIPSSAATTSLPSTAAVSTPTLIAPRRRKPTPTFYSIATDSTQLGEIPLHKWTQPYDFDQMSALNREAYENGWPNGPGMAEKKGRKRGLFWDLFRRRTS